MVPFVRCFAQYRASPSLFPRHQYPSPRPLERGGRFTRRDVTERDIHRDNRVAKAKGNGTARFRIKLFSLSYPQRQPFCPGKRYSSGCSCHGEGWFPATVGCRPCLFLSLSFSMREETCARDEEDRGGVNRRRPFRCRCPLPFRASFPLAFDFHILRLSRMFPLSCSKNPSINIFNTPLLLLVDRRCNSDRAFVLRMSSNKELNSSSAKRAKGILF